MVSVKEMDKIIVTTLARTNDVDKSLIQVLKFLNLSAGYLVVYQVSYSDIPAIERVAFWPQDHYLNQPPNWDHIAQ